MAWAPLTVVAPLTLEHRLRTVGSVVVAPGPNGFVTRGILPDQGIEPVSPTLAETTQQLDHWGKLNH